MALSNHKGKFALATSFAVMTTSSTVYAQIPPSSSEEELVGNDVSQQQTTQTNQTQIRNVRGGIKSSVKSALSRRLGGPPGTRPSGPSAPDGKKFGGPALRGGVHTAFGDPYFFGPKTEGPDGQDNASLRPTGLSGGAVSEFLEGFGAWTNVSLSTSQSRAAGTTADTDVGVLSAGIDRAVDDNLIVGLALTLSASRADSEFAVTGTGQVNLDTDGDTFGIVPYAAYIVNENVYFDLLLGVSMTDARVELRDKATGGTIFTSTGRQHTTSQFAAFTANYIDVIAEHYGLLASASVNWAENQQDDYLDDQGFIRTGEGDVDSQLVLGAQIGRALDDGMNIPYVFGYLEHDISPVERGGVAGEEPVKARNGLRLGAGLDSYYSDQLLISLEGGALFLKEDFLEFGASINLRWDF